MPSYTYDQRGDLRASSGQFAVVDGLGLFQHVAGSDEPDDDESCFATSTGRWLTGGEGAAVAGAPAQPFAAPQTPMRYHGAGHLYRPDFYNSPYNRDARQRYSGPGYFGSCSRYDGCKEVQVVPLWPYGRGN